jgi:hypothetical protein
LSPGSGASVNNALSDQSIGNLASGIIHNIISGISTVFSGTNSAVGASPAANSNLVVGGAVSAATLTPIVAGILQSFGSGVLTGNSGLVSLTNTLIQTESGGNPNAVSSTGAIGLTQLEPGTAAGLGVNPYDPSQNVAGGLTYLGQQIQRFGDLASGLAAYNLGPSRFAQIQQSGGAVPASVQNYVSGILLKSGLTGSETASQLGLGATVTAATITTPTAAQTAAVTQQAKAYADALEVEKQFDAQAQITEARQKAMADAVRLNLSAQDQQTYVSQAVQAAIDKQNAAVQKAATLQTMQTTGTLASVDAYRQSEAAGLRDEAMQEARIRVLQEGGDATALATQMLTANAAAAILSAQKNVDAQNLVVAANERLAAAARLGPAAERDAALQNEATAASQDALTKAVASGNDALKVKAQALDTATLAQARANEAAKESVSASNIVAQQKDQIALDQLQISLQGQSRDQIAAQLTLLQQKQNITDNLSLLSDDEKQDLLASTKALTDQNLALAAAVRSQEQLDEGIKSVADTVDQNLTNAIDNAFSGQTIADWGATVRSALAQIASELLDLALIKPAIGSVLSLLGLNSVAQQFGSFGSLLSAAGNLFSGNGSAGSDTGDQDFSSATGVTTSTTGEILQGGSLLSNLFGSSSSGTGLFGAFSSLTDAINNFGTNFGFAAPSIDLSGAEGQLGLFGGTTLTGFLGPAAFGFGAGSLLNSILGGNAGTGMIGSGLGSLGGALAAGVLGLGPVGLLAGAPLGRVSGGFATLFGRESR